jgi:hypothetical protein
MYFPLIKGPTCRNLDFEEREKVRENLINRLEAHGIRFVQYNWVWDEQDRCLLLAGEYRHLDDAYWWIKALKSMGFEICIRTHLPGDESESKGDMISETLDVRNDRLRRDRSGRGDTHR